jgi:hypothetical protein
VENERKIKPLTAQEVVETVNQALDGVQSNPCCICPREGICGIKYKGVCKVNRQLRIKFMKVERLEETTNGRNY